MALWRSRVRAPLGPLSFFLIRNKPIINQSGTAKPLSSLNERGFFIADFGLMIDDLETVNRQSQIVNRNGRFIY